MKKYSRDDPLTTSALLDRGAEIFAKKRFKYARSRTQEAGSIWREPEGKKIVYSQVYVVQEQVFPGLVLGSASVHADYHTDNAQYQQQRH